MAIVCGSEGLKVNFEILQKHWLKGQTRSSTKTKGVGSAILPHVIIPILGRFKGEQGERYHLLALAQLTSSGVHIRNTIRVLLLMRERFKINSVWLFTDLHGNKLTFESMNEIILERLDMLKDSDTDNILGLKDCAIREDFSINCSF